MPGKGTHPKVMGSTNCIWWFSKKEKKQSSMVKGVGLGREGVGSQAKYDF